MILPNKNLRLQNSLFGIGAGLLPALSTHQSVSELWDRAQHQTDLTISFEKFILTLDFLYAVGLVEVENGLLKGKRYVS